MGFLSDVAHSIKIHHRRIARDLLLVFHLLLIFDRQSLAASQGRDFVRPLERIGRLCSTDIIPGVWVDKCQNG